MHIYALLAALTTLWASANSSPLLACDNDGINTFVADDRSLCTFYQCAFGKPYQVSCAKGSRVPSYFTKGPSNPCIVKVKKNTIVVCDRCNVTDDPIPGPNKTNQCALFRPCDARPGCTCVDQVAGYYCSCPPAATVGPTPANTPVQQCDVNVCKNGGTCYSLYKNKFCNCKPPYTGKFCEANACEELECNNGICTFDSFSVFCECEPCYTGECCEDRIVNCTSNCNECVGGANCTTPRLNKCKCNKCTNEGDSCIDNKPGKIRQCVKPPDTAASEFTLMFEQNLGDDDFVLEIYVSAASEDDQDRTVTVDAPLMSYSESAVIPNTKVKIFLVDVGLMHKGVGKQNVGIRVRETNKKLVNVYCINRAAYSADGWLALPDNVAGREFKVITYSPVVKAGQFAFVAIQNNTVVTIYLVDGSEAITGSGKNTAVVVHLNAWQTYQVQSNRSTADFTGTSIISNNPIHVYSGEGRAWVAPTPAYKYYKEAIGKSDKSRDILVMECTSIDTWGTTFAIVPLPRTMIDARYDTTEELVRIVGWVATSCKLYATWNESYHTELEITLNFDSNYYIQFPLDAAYNYFLSCNQTVMLVEITESAIFEQTDKKQYNDPSFIYVPAVSSYSNFYHFVPPSFHDGNPYSWTYVRLIATASEYQGIKINNELIKDLYLERVKNWTQIYIPNAGTSSNFPDLYGSLVRISSINSTSILHEDPRASFAAIVEGFDDRESYGIVLGASIKPRNSSFSAAALQTSYPVVATIL